MGSRSLASLASLALVLAVAVPVAAADPTPPPREAPPLSAAIEVPEVGGGFGDYELVPLLTDDTPYAGPATPRSLAGVEVDDGSVVQQWLKDPAVATDLARKGFVIVPAEYARFSQAYESQRYSGVPAFVTTDAAYNAWHNVFDKVLRTLETTVLLPKLEALVTGMLANARAQKTELAGTDLADPADRVVQLLQVAGSALGLDVGRLGPLARAEKAFIDAHDALETSPILGTDIDYSLYTPRGHYTRTPQLTRYFVAMSVLGQTAFAMPGALQNDLSRADASGLRLAALASRTFVGDEELEQLWKDIYEPTAFLVGISDDYTPFELAEAVDAVVPGGMDDPTPLADDVTIEDIAADMAAVRPVLIDSERPAVRLMGTRFVIDSFVYDQLLAPNVGTREDPRLIPSPLDLASAFGSKFAFALQRNAGQTEFQNYTSQMMAMRQAIADRPDEAWGRTVYDAWLAAIEPMWLPHGAAFPDFMRGRAWTAKAHQTGFGSYTELKHDTILYVKQAVGEMGDAGGGAIPRSWVEPDPVPFERLAAMADLARAGLNDRGLLSRKMDQLLADVSDLFTFLARIARDELAGEPISEDDNRTLLGIGGILEDIWWRSSDAKRTALPAPDEMDALVADIASGRDRETDTIKVLEVATGYVDAILVIVPDDEGTFHVAQGGAYSYYEFLQPVSERLTDEAWRAMLLAGEAPDRPAWTALTR
jgi:hypothetical protein